VTADAAVRAGEIPAMIIVMPDAGVTWYVNDVAGDVPYERMFVEELLPHIDSTYRTRAKREFRGLSGLSMGGYGSLMLAMRHIDLFVAVAALSSGVLTDDEVKGMESDGWARTFSTPFGQDLTGGERLSEHWRAYNPLDLARTLPVEELEKVRWYLDCGDDDFLYKGNAMLHVTLRDRQIPHEFRVRDGGHSWSYWRTGIGPALRFIGESFHR
jgi:enterochelin esterase-like enzyme